MRTVSPPSSARKTRRGGGFYRSADGTWVIDLTYRGHRVRKRLGRGLPLDTVKQIAQRESLALRTSILLTGKPPAAPKVTDLSIAAGLTRYEQVAFKDLRPRTRRLYLALMKPLRKHLGDVRLSALSPFDLEKYRQTRTAPAPGRRGSGRTSTNRELGLLSAMIVRCQSWGLTTRTDNPCDAVKHFTESKGRERILSYPEQDRLLAALPEPHATVVQLALETGCRLQSELLPAVWADVNLDRAQLTITATHSKNGRARHLPLSPAMVAKLRAMKATSQHALVFPARGGGYLHRFKTIYFQTVRQLGLAGTGLNVHALRHTFASRMVESGADLTMLMALGGWSSLAMVQRYSHHRPQRAVEAITHMLEAREREPRDVPQSSPRPITRVRPNA